MKTTVITIILSLVTTSASADAERVREAREELNRIVTFAKTYGVYDKQEMLSARYELGQALEEHKQELMDERIAEAQAKEQERLERAQEKAEQQAREKALRQFERQAKKTCTADTKVYYDLCLAEGNAMTACDAHRAANEIVCTSSTEKATRFEATSFGHIAEQQVINEARDRQRALEAQIELQKQQNELARLQAEREERDRAARLQRQAELPMIRAQCRENEKAQAVRTLQVVMKRDVSATIAAYRARVKLCDTMM